MTEKIFYQKNFEVGKFLYETYGLFETVAPNETEQDAWERAELKVLARYMDAHPEQRGTTTNTILEAGLPVIQTKDL